MQFSTGVRCEDRLGTGASYVPRWRIEGSQVCFFTLEKSSLIVHLIESFLPTVLVKFVTFFLPNVPVLSNIVL